MIRCFAGNTLVSREYYNGCMLDQNRRLVNPAGVLLAVYNGERRGGTAATVSYARKVGCQIVIFDPIPLYPSNTLRSEVAWTTSSNVYSENEQKDLCAGCGAGFLSIWPFSRFLIKIRKGKSYYEEKSHRTMC